jgi:hypothetical protein
VNPLDFLRATPRTNCGQCGQPTCLAYAVAVTKGGADPGLCPHLAPTGLEGARWHAAGDRLAQVERGRDERDMALVAHLKTKIQGLDYPAIASRLGTEFDPGPPAALHFRYLGRRVVLSGEKALMEGGQLIDPRDQILLYNYVASGGGQTPRGVWVGMESLPNSMAKVRTLAAYCEQPLASRFRGRAAALARVCSLIGAMPDPEGQSADLGLVLPVLPFLPLYLLFWDEEPEEGFVSRVKVLFDQRVLDFLDIESLVFATERMAERLMELDA